jgi:hypothetical protein
LFHPPVYTVTDNIAGTGLFRELTGAEGVLQLVDGREVIFDKKRGGRKRRRLSITATRALISDSTGQTKIKTRKSCTVIVNLRNSNDRPYITGGQVRTIEEGSAVDILVQTPVEANDVDDGQTFEFSVDDSQFGNGWYDETHGSNVAASNIPFSIGKCSGIFKVKKDVLRYDDDNSIPGIRLYTVALIVKDQDDDDANFDNADCKDNGAGASRAYCQKSGQATVQIEVLNKNDAPYISTANEGTNTGFSIGEHAANKDEVGTIAFSDPTWATPTRSR